MSYLRSSTSTAPASAIPLTPPPWRTRSAGSGDVGTLDVGELMAFLRGTPGSVTAACPLFGGAARVPPRRAGTVTVAACMALGKDVPTNCRDLRASVTLWAPSRCAVLGAALTGAD